MKTVSRSIYLTLSVCAAIALLAGCGEWRAASPLPAQPMNRLAAPLGQSGYKVLYSFKGGPNGAYPSGGLAEVNEVLYGVTTNGGSGCSGYGCGTAFSIARSGQEKVIYAFKSGSDGRSPSGLLSVVHGALYGSTLFGGDNAGCSDGCGTIFQLTTSGAEKVVYRFKGGRSGYYPNGGLTSLGNVLYGTTGLGGNGYGTVFAVTLSGKETTLYRFRGSPDNDGDDPNGGLVAVNNVLYGTTFFGGSCSTKGGCGTVFDVTTSGKESVLHGFKGSDDAYCYKNQKDGASPAAGLVAFKGMLYGTTASGGFCSNNRSGGNPLGTAFAMTKGGTEHVIHYFHGDDGANPYSKLTAYNGILYGTTDSDGNGGLGNVFSLTTVGKEQVLHSFKGSTYDDGAGPLGGLMALNGTLYGVTAIGGLSNCGQSGNGCGTVFQISP